MTTAAELTAAIIALSSEFQDDGMNPTQINTGHCADFADALSQRIDVELLGTDDVFEDRVGQPPPGISWDDLKTWYLPHVGHTWLVLDGRHYDAEHLEGVDNPFDISCLRCGLHELIDLMSPGRIAELEANHDWWRETARLRVEREALMSSHPTP